MSGTFTPVTYTVVMGKTSTMHGTVALDIGVTAYPATIVSGVTSSGGTVTATTISLGKVFAIEEFPASADSTNSVYRFSHVCSPAEMVEFPEDAPGENCYFRISNVRMLFDSVAIADSTADAVVGDIRQLKNEYNAMDTAEVKSTTVTV